MRNFKLGKDPRFVLAGIPSMDRGWVRCSVGKLHWGHHHVHHGGKKLQLRLCQYLAVFDSVNTNEKRLYLIFRS